MDIYGSFLFAWVISIIFRLLFTMISNSDGSLFDHAKLSYDSSIPLCDPETLK